jgi:hypothetical protein
MKKPRRINIVPVRFTDIGLRTIDDERGQVTRADYIRQCVAYAITAKFKPRVRKEEL